MQHVSHATSIWRVYLFSKSVVETIFPLGSHICLKKNIYKHFFKPFSALTCLYMSQKAFYIYIYNLKVCLIKSNHTKKYFDSSLGIDPYESPCEIISL